MLYVIMNVNLYGFKLVSCLPLKLPDLIGFDILYVMKKIVMGVGLILLLIITWVFFVPQEYKEHVYLGGYRTYLSLMDHKDVIMLPEYKMVTSYSSLNGGFSCSEPIRAKLIDIADQLGGTGKGYWPVDMNEAKLVCHLTFIP
jgi:hypothetical protein